MRVRSFTLGYHDLNDDIYHALRHHFPQEPMFPHLTMLRFVSDPRRGYRGLETFLSTSLRTLILSHPERTQEVVDQELAEILSRRTPRLSDLQVFCGADVHDERFERHVSDVVESLEFLKCISVAFGLTSRALNSLGSRATCQELFLHADNRLFYHDLLSSKFQFLRKLEIVSHISDPSALITFLNTLHSDNLRDLRIEFIPDKWRAGHSAQPPACDMKRMFKAVSKFHALLCLFVRYQGETSVTDEYVLDISTLSLLFRIRGLQKLYLARIPFRLTHDALVDIASMWSDIRSLMLGQDCSMPTGVTIEDLLPFALNCPALKRLGILIDTPDPILHSSKRPAAGRAHPSQLDWLDLGRSQVRYVEGLAIFVSGAFPRASINIAWNAPLTIRELIRRANELVAAFVHVGEQERAAATLHGLSSS